MTKVDLKKVLGSYKAKRGRFDIVRIPVMRYLMIDGHNGPGSRDFVAAIEALYPVAYKLKFMSKLDLNQDYVVPPLEALWWADDMTVFTTRFDQSRWDWTAMLMVPEWIGEDLYLESVRFQLAAGKIEPANAERIRFATLDEGLSVQTLHLGAYSDEGPVLAEMHNTFIPDNHLAMQGKHHEIYFNDFRKVAPEKLRTILRQPVHSTAQGSH